MIKYLLQTGMQFIWLVSIMVASATMLSVTGWSAWFAQRHLVALYLSPALLCAFVFFIKNSIFNNFEYFKSKKHYAYKIAFALALCTIFLFGFFLITKYVFAVSVSQEKHLQILTSFLLGIAMLFCSTVLVDYVSADNLSIQENENRFLSGVKTLYKAPIAVIVTLIIEFVLMFVLFKNSDNFSLEIANGDMSIPSVIIKGILDGGGSWFTNPNVGYPTGLRIYDFPTTDTLPWIILSIIGLFNKSWISIVETYNLLVYPLTALCALWACRHIKLKYTIAIPVSILYSFLYYRITRSWGHFFLGTYFWIPLIIAVCIDIMEGKTLFAEQFINGKIKTAWYKNKNLIFAIFVALGAGLIGIYYSFFACFFFAFAGVYAWLYAKKIRHFFDAGIMILLSGLGVLASLIPHFLFWYRYGKSVSFARSPVEAEMYGLKLSQLLLPIAGRRPAWLDNTVSTLPFENENATTALGLIAALGLLILLAYKIFRIKKKNALLDHFASLNLVGILLAVIGGFGVLFAIFISPQIRGYNRIVVYLAFFALVAFFIVLNKLLDKKIFTKLFFGSKIVIIGGIALLGIHLQVPSLGSIPSRDNRSKIEMQFIAEIEKSYPDGANIFQYPVMSFPEGGGVEKMGDYEHFLPYLAGSAKLHWTYGAMRIRDDTWYQDVGKKPLTEALAMMREKNINGIFINRRGYKDRGAVLEAELVSLTGTNPLICENNDWVFFQLEQAEAKK